MDIVLDRLKDKPLSDEASDLLLAALDGDEALSAQLDADPVERHVQRPEAAGEGAKSPVGAYLRSVTVSGFRGIGPAATLNIAPGPGLTLVVGRNGSGKSSFAEALEVLLTGTLTRWRDAPLVVREGWRSKHAAETAGIHAEFLVEGKGETVVTRTWAAGADVGAADAWMQVAGQKRGPIEDLGWDASLKGHRPFLSHAELEAFFGRPSELHDLLASVLGLDDLADADKRLKAARRQREDALAAVKQRLEPLKERLAALAENDERARMCHTALSGKNWDIAYAKSAATGSSLPDDGQLALLRRLAQLSSPAAADVAEAAEILRTAATGLEQMQGTSAEQSLNLAQLLDVALKHHQSHGDGDCPVCGRPGALSAEWRVATQAHANRLRAQAHDAQAAVTQAASAVNKALALMQPPPPVLTETESETGGESLGPDTSPARKAWRAWAQKPDGADPATSAGVTALAEHLETALTALTDAVTSLAAEAGKELAQRDDRWAPVAADVASWCADAELAIDANKPVASLKEARKWLVDATAYLREERLAPLAEQSRAIWAELRQESNVDLGAFRLAGTANQRKLELDVNIDGLPGAALGVMSQGEINALALSIFLPRATMQQTPFNFLVIDDPVQAMDPAKVDGLARVLEKVAADRQVIVLTHDNRLAAAVKDLCIPATILEVTRRPKSVVEVRECLDSVAQALKDANSVNADQNVPAQVAARVIPGLCRTAVEAAFMQAFWRRQLRDGRTRTEIEADMEGKKLKLVSVAALAMFGDTDASGKVLPALNRHGSHFGDTVQLLNRGTHEGHGGDLGNLISRTRKLVAKIEEILP